MKVLLKFNLALLLTLLYVPLWASVTKSDHEQTKEIVEEFDVNASSNIVFNHRRGTLFVKYIEGNKAKIQATVTVKGDDQADIQSILDAMSIDIEKTTEGIEINTANNIKTWSSNTGFFTTRHELIMKDGRKITSKVEQISIAATLYLPKIRKVVLNNKYDDIIVDDCRAAQLEVGIHSATFEASNVEAESLVKIKYGKLKLKNMGDLTIESHDSKGTIGDSGKLILKDKYSDFVFGNAQSLDAEFHDGNFKMGSIAGHANIKDKYSVIELGDIKNGKWNLHDSKVILNKGAALTIISKYTDFVLKTVDKIDLESHDDNFKISEIKTLHVAHSKYTEYDIDRLHQAIYVDDSHDDDFHIIRTSDSVTEIELTGKYTDLKLPLPTGKNYSLEAQMKYGDLKYPKAGLKETIHIEKDSELKVSGIPSNNNSNLKVVVKGHDCNINLQ